MRVLLVEEHPTDRMLLDTLLRARGHEVTSPPDAEIAVQAFHQQPYSLAIIDWLQSGMSAADLCRRLRAAPCGDRLVILAVAPSDQSHLSPSALCSDVDELLPRPLDESLIQLRLITAERRVNSLTSRPPLEDWRARGTVLVVDDEEPIRQIAQKIIERTGMSVLLASDGRTGVELFRQSASEISLVLLDMKMPGMGGEEVFREIRLIDPQAKAILSTGLTEDEVASRFAGLGIAGVVQKPYNLRTLLGKLRAILEPDTP